MGASGARPTAIAAGWPAGPLGDVLGELIADIGRPDGSDPTVLDCGGGSGGLAVPIAVRGDRVTVVDASIDALATLQRRAAEAGVADRVHAVQGDVENLADLTDLAAGEAGAADLVLLHGVIDSTQTAGPVIAAAAQAVRPGGHLSIVVANPAATVLARALGGDLDAALAELDRPQPALSLPWLQAAAEQAGFEVRVAQGLAAFSSTVPGSVISASHHAGDVLAALDRVAATRPPYRDIAGYLHLLARRPVPLPAGR